MFLSVCEDYSFLSVISMIKDGLDIICIIVPVLLIVLLGVDISKMVMGNEKTQKIMIKHVISRTVAAVLLFFVPLLVNLLLSLLGTTKVMDTACWSNANETTIAEMKAVEEAKMKEEEVAKKEESEQAKKQRDEIEKLREEQRKKNEKLAEEERKKRERSNGGKALGDVIYYNQCDPAFGSVTYWPSCGDICHCGCGPTSSAIIASTFLGANGHGPVDAKNWICAHGGCTASGTVAKTDADYLTSLGLKVDGPHYWTQGEITDLMSKLSSGNYLAIILVNNVTGRNIFTSGGHYFVLRGVENGEFTIAQPSREWQNHKTWPISSFTGDVTNFYLVSKD